MSAAVAIPIRAVQQSVESFESRGEKRRLRLTSEEARYVRYVLCEWDGDCGAGSSMGMQLEKLAQRPKYAPMHGQARPQWWEQTMYVPSPAPSMRERDWPQDRYCGKRAEERASILRSWRALRAMASEPVAVLIALYGEVLPGTPDRELCKSIWPKDVWEDYRRVSRYAADGGSAAYFEAAIRVDRAKRQGEPPDAHRTRVGIATAARAERIREIGNECERLIVAACHAYRAAWWTADGVALRAAQSGAPAISVIREEVPVGMMGAVVP